jgi:hypothetical protein
MFFSDNREIIARKWKFDTDNRAGMISMFQQFKDLKVDTNTVLLFIRDIGFDINSLKGTKDLET